MMEAIRHNPEDGILHSLRRETLKFYFQWLNNEYCDLRVHRCMQWAMWTCPMFAVQSWRGTGWNACGCEYKGAFIFIRFCLN
jgi:hypothetical protein